MPEPIRWNTPGVTWNDPRGLTWNGTLPDTPPPPVKGKRSMAMSMTETFGFSDQVAQAAENNKALLLVKKLDTSTWKDEMKDLKDDAVDANEKQEAAKAALRDKTTITDNAIQAVYDDASSKLDAMIGAVGKTTELGKQLARIRSTILQKPKAKPQTPPSP